MHDAVHDWPRNPPPRRADRDAPRIEGRNAYRRQALSGLATKSSVQPGTSSRQRSSGPESSTATQSSSAGGSAASRARRRSPASDVPAFRSYAARMGTPAWQQALADELAQPTPCFMCAETDWRRCHRRLISELLVARGHPVMHLLGPGRQDRHRLYDESEVRDGSLYLCWVSVVGLKNAKHSRGKRLISQGE